MCLKYYLRTLERNDMRFFTVPCVVIQLGIKGSCLGVLVALIYLEDKYRGSSFLRKEGKWFNVSNEELCDISGVGAETLVKNRLWLSDSGYIEFIRGHSGVNTKYRICVDAFYRADRLLSIPEKPLLQ